MIETTVLPRFADIADRYDVLFCDVWGVLHNGRNNYPAACEALVRFRQERGPVVLISNSPRPSTDVVAQLRALGVPDEAWSRFVTSGDATRVELSKRSPGPAWAVGPARDAPLYEGTGVGYAETPYEATFVSCTGPFDDDKDQPEDYRERFEVCVERGLTMVCANPDKVVHRGAKLIWCAGALADLYAELGGQVVMAGKPFAPIYDAVMAEAADLMGGAPDPARVLCVGDGIPTDVLGANKAGLDVLFVVGTGIHGAEATGPDGELDHGLIEQMLAKAGAQAKYAIRDLVW
ncbi:TIGR01459 family HAD-type hydrolase [Caulobacter sp. 17J65-9]|uniref:TIGR01459 family HAD-type hydrolase n=1 Tax=Caulobacter sp. 17J65-9 TaxID=2709382 RepID=UPI0013C75E12|nr:TIGR01459 family HAD-type hydrolase [Caulobacter sp. 17J65-9]NEX94557.1 TIGR01459 family HAD-type hydrolase [Caulobacter sp. 17J65-9]